ncbi:unnamed protein product [Orchesella dallaii]|uniref:DUF4789 domain-containing protein n=1 Tax=Orchesella dallaii TaxID=48710 RepID=A0ABP1Q6K4_9HEXA
MSDGIRSNITSLSVVKDGPSTWISEKVKSSSKNFLFYKILAKMQKKFALVFVQLSACLLVPVFSSIQEPEQLPVCPQKFVDEYEFPYVVYGKPSQCYVARRQGPCSNGSVLYAKPRSHFGVCSCECFLDEGIVFDDSVMRDYRYCFNKRVGQIFVYDKKRCACYQLGTQGSCPEGKRLEKGIYEEAPTCVPDAPNDNNREDQSEQSHTQLESKCPEGTIYSTLLNICTDMNFRGLSKSNGSVPTTSGKCPSGTIYSTLLNICTDMNFHGLTTNGDASSSSSVTTTGRCPPGTIYSTLLNICTDMNFKGLSNGGNSNGGSRGKCPPGTIYSTLLNICTDMNFRGLPPLRKCPPGTIYSTLLNICTDMNFRARSSGKKCPPGTIYSTLLNKCTDMNFKGLDGSSTTNVPPAKKKCPTGTIYSTLLNKCTDMNFKGLQQSSSNSLQ